jgi:hypothetical protein
LSSQEQPYFSHSTFFLAPQGPSTPLGVRGWHNCHSRNGLCWLGGIPAPIQVLPPDQRNGNSEVWQGSHMTSRFSSIAEGQQLLCGWCWGAGCLAAVEDFLRNFQL